MIDLLLCLSDRGGLDALGLQPGVAFQGLQRGGQIVVHEVVELGFLFRSLVQNGKNLTGQVFDPVNLRGDLFIVNQVVVGPNLLENAVIAGNSLLLLLLWLNSLGLGVLGQHQAVGFQIQPGRPENAAGNHFPQVLDDLVIVDAHHICQVVDGDGLLVTDQLEIGLKSLLLFAAKMSEYGHCRAADGSAQEKKG